MKLIKNEMLKSFALEVNKFEVKMLISFIPLQYSNDRSVCIEIRKQITPD